MFDKLKFNNLVISNKKGIQQSRIQTINKLVHKMRKLQTLLEKHPDNIKCKERIRKSNEAMEILKKIKRVEVMKKILLMDKPPAAIITNGLATPEEVAIALLSMNKVMLGLIKRFKSELILDESKREKWQQSLMETSKRRQKIERTEEKRRKRLEMKQQKVLGHKRQEWLEQNCPKDENVHNVNENSNDLNISTTGNWQIEKMANEAEEDKGESKKEVVSSTLLSRSIKEKTKKTDFPNKKQKIKEAEKKYEDKNESDKEKNEKTLVEFEDSKGYENAEENEDSLVVDPFFITDTGENYLSTAVVKNDQNANEDNDEEKRDLHMIKLNNVKKPKDFKERGQQSRDRYQRDFKNIKTSTIKNQWQTEKTNMWSNKNNNRDKKWQNKKSEIQTNDQNLHPSWAAKQKFKPVISSFQGKKIKFDDDAQISNKQSALHQKNIKPSSSEFKTGNVEQDSLHPSWAAKQKLKPTITAFQGKKITFDNDD